MADYYELLQRSELGRSAKVEERRAAYDRARHVLLKKLLAEDPPLPAAFIWAEQASFDAAVLRFEERVAVLVSDRNLEEAERPDPFVVTPKRPRAGLLIGVVSVVALLVAGSIGYFYWSHWRSSAKNGPLVPRASPARLVEFDDRRVAATTNAADDTLPYIFRRQLVYFRTTNPIGSVVVDKAQRYLYLVRSPVVAIRYGIGVGRECLESSGLLRVSRKEERLISPSRQAASGQGFVPGPDPQRPDNPFGSRTIYLDSNATHLIHGTHIPKSIGRSVWLGCFRLIDNDVIELYDLVSVGGRVVITN